MPPSMDSSLRKQLTRSSSSKFKMLQKQRSTRNRKKSVEFCSGQPEIYHVPATSLLTRDEIENTWFSADELLLIEEEVEEHQKNAESKDDCCEREIANHGAGNSVCLRGIPKEAEILKKQFYHNEAVKAVLKEQEKQRLLKLKDPDTIRTLMLFWTKTATAEALSRAKQDRAAVEEDLSTSKEKLSLPSLTTLLLQDRGNLLDYTLPLLMPPHAGEQ